MSKSIQPGSRLHRSIQVERAAIVEEARTVDLAFSSETPYERWWGVEILDHSPQSIRLNRLSGGAPLLIDHDNSIRSQVGVIESVEIGADRVGRATVRFGKDAFADEIYQKVLDGIVRNVSVGYMIHEAKLVESTDQQDTYRVTDWEPFEVSLVSVPADASVGVGRAAGTEDAIEFIEIQAKGEITMAETTVTVDPAEAKRIADAAMNDYRAGEQKRVSDIIAIGEQFARYGADKMASEALRSGASVDEFRAKVLEKVTTAAKPVADIGLTDQEARRFSFLRAINALANPGDRKAQDDAAFERECSDAVAGKLGKGSRGLWVPAEVQRRDLTVGTAADGGHTVATNLLAANFIDLLRNKMAVIDMGAQMLTGLVGNIAIPRQTGGGTAYWVAESGAPTESQQAFDQVTMSPKTVGAFSDISRKLLLQSSLDIEGFVRNDLATVLALAIDLAAINGSGVSNQPTGILNTTGIGDVAGGTNGLAPTWAHMIELETDVAVANADVGALGYLTNAKVRGKLKTTEKFSTTGQVVWGDGATPVNGYKAGVSNQVPSNLTKGTSSGVCSAIIFGNFADLIIGQWGALDLMVDPYTNSTSGTVRVVALQDVDIAVRHAQSFSAMKDALTA